MISRRKFLGFATGAAGALLLPELIAPHRSIFLPPIGGWPGPYAALIIPRHDIHMWAAEIAAGNMAYDPETEVLSLLKMSEPTHGTVETMRTPNEWQIAEDIEADEFGNFASGGARPIRYNTFGRDVIDDAREVALRAEKLRKLREAHPALVGTRSRNGRSSDHFLSLVDVC